MASSRNHQCAIVVSVVALVLLSTLCSLQQVIEARLVEYPVSSSSSIAQQELHYGADHHERKLSVLFEPEPLRLSYRGGTILSGEELPVYIIWYGRFSSFERSNVLDFFASFQPTSSFRPSVTSWWELTAAYKDAQGMSVSSAVELKQEIFDEEYSMGRYLVEAHIEGLLLRSLHTSFPANHNAFYLVLTALDVYVEGFCTRRCASHFATKQNLFAPAFSGTDPNDIIPYAWVGNAVSQCPGKCSWPFAKGEYGYDTEPLKPPSGDVGVEGMIMNIAVMLAGTATNPRNDGFFQGDQDLPLEAATACTGMFGLGAYSGYPGELQTEFSTGASFNAHGVNNRNFLLPALWNPLTGSCTHPPS